MKRISIKKGGLSDFLKSHVISKANKDTIISTHTSMKGGSYYISDNDIDEFYRLHYDDVFVKGNKEFLVERQLSNDKSPILIDIDLKYAPNITTRQHTEEDIAVILDLYFDNLKELLVLDESLDIPVYIFEKPNVN